MTLPVTIVEGAFLIPATINDIPVQMQLDTGATASLVDQTMAARLSLPTDPHGHTTVHGTGGDIVTSNAIIRSLGIGGSQWQAMSITTGQVPLRVQRDDLPDDLPIAGQLGADWLADFDVELDVPHGRVTFWHATHCEGDFVPWNVPHFAIPLARHNPNRMIAQVEVDGHPVAALIDWGARVTIITDAVASRLGVTMDMLARDRSATGQGVDQTKTTFRLHGFAEMRIGPEVFRNPDIQVADLHLQEAGMLLGADYARSRRIWLSYATRQMFVALPNTTAQNVTAAN